MRLFGYNFVKFFAEGKLHRLQNLPATAFAGSNAILGICPAQKYAITNLKHKF